jgi:general secretion pathway protein N
LPAAPALTHYAAIWQRPLFNADRRPAPTAMAGDASDVTLGDLVLTGIIITPTLRMALLHNRQTGEDSSVTQGASVAGGRWTLQTLAPRSATFDGEGGRTVLPLQVATHTGPGTQGNAQAAPAPAPATGAMVHVGTPNAASHTRTAVPRLTLQAVGSELQPTAAQIAAGNARKAAVKARLKERLEHQRRQPSQGAQGDR